MNASPSKRNFIRNAFSFAAIFATAASAPAATYDWIGGTSSAWTTAANWSPVPPTFPVAADTVLFGVNSAVTSATTDLGGAQVVGSSANNSAALSVLRYATNGATTSYTLQNGTVTLGTSGSATANPFLIGAGVTLDLNATVNHPVAAASGQTINYNASTNATLNIGASAASNGRFNFIPLATGVTAVANVNAVNFALNQRWNIGNNNVAADVTVNVNANQRNTCGLSPNGGSWLIGDVATGYEARMVVRNGAFVSLNGRLALGGFTANRGTGRLVIGDATTTGSFTNDANTAGSGVWLQIGRSAGTTGIVDVVNGVFVAQINNPTLPATLLPYVNDATARAEINLYTNGTLITRCIFGKNVNGTGMINFRGGTFQADAALLTAQGNDLLQANLPVNVYDGGAVMDNNGMAMTINAGLLNPGGSTGGLSLRGSGTTTLNGANTFTGPTLVRQGTLALDASFSTLSAITVSNGATLGFKSGTLASNPNATLLDGATIRSLSATAGTVMTVNALTLGATTNGAIVNVQFNAGGSMNDSFTVAGAGGLVLNGGRFNLYVEGTTSPFATVGTYTLFNYSGALGGSVSNLVVNNPSAGSSYAFTNTGTAIQVIIGVAPVNQWAVDADGNWSQAANWTVGVPNAVNDQALFGNIITAPRAVANDAAHTVGRIEFANGNSYTVNGPGVLTLGSSSNAVVTTTAGSHTINAPIALATNTQFSAANNQTLTLAGGITGSSSFLVTSNAGAVAILGTNTAPVTVESGAAYITGGGQVTQPLTLLGGTTFFDSEANLGPNPGAPNPNQLLLNGGTLRSTGTATISDSNRGITLGTNGGTLGSSSGVFTLTVANSITGSGSLTKTFGSQGTLQLTANNTYSGNTIIDRGEVMVGNGGTTGSLGTGTNVTILNSSFLTLNRSDVSSLTTSVTLGSGGGGIRNNTPNVLTLGSTIDAATNNLTLDTLTTDIVLPGANLLNYNGITKTSGNTLTLTGSQTATALGSFGRIEVVSGTVALASGANWNITNATSQQIRLGTVAFTGAGASMIVSNGATLTVKGMSIGQVVGSQGTSFTLDGGTVNLINANSDVLMLHEGGSGGISDNLTVNSGTMTAPEPTSRVNIGRRGDANFTINNGTVSFNRAGFGNIGAVANLVTDGSAVITLNGGSLNISNQFELMADSATTPVRANTVNLNGGTLSTVAMNCSHPSATITFNFNGGRLVALGNALTAGVAGGTGSLADFLKGVDVASVQPGGAIIDSGGYDMTITQGLQDAGGGLTKLGSGLLALNGVNTYTGLTTVSNGSLGGTGSIAGPVTVTAGGTLAPGTSIGTLTVSNNVILGGTTLMELNPTGSDLLRVTGTLTGGGTLIVTNIGGTLTNGTVFTLFNVPASGFATTLPAGYTWNNNLASSGTITVVSGGISLMNTTPTNITYSASGGNLTLSWPSDYTGWLLQAQTNSRSVGLGTNWITIGGSEATNTMTFPVNPAEPTVFYRLKLP